MDNVYLHNTLSGKKEIFKPLKNNMVGLYSCGPTVYDFAHIGNFRSFLMSDLLVRVLKYAGHKVTKVQNITDVGHLVSDADEGEDKILKKARMEKKDPFAIARFFEDAFIEDEKKLRILPPQHRPRATEYIKEQIELTKTLIKNGYAYEKNGSVYFSTKKFKKYGELSGNKLDDLLAGARVEVNDEKENPLDFALWKKAEPNHLMQWESPWGQGFPGWHIECSAMSRKLLGEHFDIHTGGEDNIFPHHECEIAQNEAATGDGKPCVQVWMHAKHLMVDGKKMSKSEGNFYTVRDLFEKGWKGEEIRYLLLSAHYRTALNFTFEGLEMARNSINRIEEARRIFDFFRGNINTSSNFTKKYREKYQLALFDDLNVSDALATVFEMIKEGLRKREEKTLSKEDAYAIVQFLSDDFDWIFSVLLPVPRFNPDKLPEINKLIKQRNNARKEKNYEESDRIRDELAQKFNIEIIDEKDGTTSWKIKNT